MIKQKIIKTFYKATDKFHKRVKHLVFICNSCNKNFIRLASCYRKQLKTSKNACCFCSMSCKSKWIAKKTFPGGKNHPQWKGGRRINDQGYVQIYKPNHPHKIKNYVIEHILIMEKKIGRFLKTSEFVHHKDNNRQNNSINNLEILTNSEHARLHGKINGCPANFTMKGKKHSKKSKLKMRIAHLGKKMPHIANNHNNR